MQEIGAIEADRLLNTASEDLARHFEAKYRLDVPALKVADILVDSREKQIDVSRDQNRMILDRSRPFYVTATEIAVEVPFDGDASAFTIRPNPHTLSPPVAQVVDMNLLFSIVGTSLNSNGVKGEVDARIQSIQGYLNNLRTNAEMLNGQLFKEALAAIDARRSKLLTSRGLAASLGFKVKERPGPSATYTAPEVRRKLAPTLPAASSAPYVPEPALSTDDYEHILAVIQGMVLVMERSPSAFASLDEEALRSHFLVQLNGHYEGQATGETFNYQGKTDILVRSEGRNIFIGECKFWGGQKMLTETLDQLLGYSSWRDTKTAVIIFNRNRDFGRVLATIPNTARAHPQFKRELPGSRETMFRYVFANRDDRNRELLLTILAFDVPAPMVK